MSFKVLGITAGRKDSNSEILLKEALLACKEKSADVKMINLKDYNIFDCTGCTACTQGVVEGKKVPCILENKDDKKKIMDVMLDTDAIIVSIPTYYLMPNAAFLRFMQRNLCYETPFLEAIGETVHKDKVAGLISVGGSTRAWQSMSLEALQVTCTLNDYKVIDMYMATRVAAPKQCLLDDSMIERAHKVGDNIMKSLNTPASEREWLGDDDMGWCPNCHSNALILGEPQWDGIKFDVECQVCGAGGTLEKTNEGKWKFIIDSNGLIRDRTTPEGRRHHVKEIGVTQGGFYNEENLKSTKEKFEKYGNITFPSI